MSRFTRRPLPLRLVNALLPSSERFDPVALVGAAARAEGRGFDDDAFAEGLGVLCESIEGEARLHALGRAIARSRIVGNLRMRLRLEAAHSSAPARFDRPLPRPIVICGLPRTGTTFLHRLMAGSGLRALRTWEALDPIPGPSEPRRRKARLNEAALGAMAPTFFAAHPIDAEGVEEEVLLFEPTFHSMIPSATMNVPRYMDWYERSDPVPAYRMVQQILAGLGGGQRWVLKTPQHLEWIDVLLETFPDALLVWTHREPRELAPSLFSLVALGHGVLSDEVDPHAIATQWRRKIRRVVRRGLAARDRVGEERFVDISYRALVDDPEGVVIDLLERAEVPVTEAVRFGIADARRQQPRHRHGVHRYDLTEFGVTPEAIDDDLRAYRDRYGEYV